MSMVEPEFTRFQVQVEAMFGDAVERRKSSFGKTPKGFDSARVMFSPGELVVAMIDPEMPVKADIHQSIVATPAVGVDDAVDVSLASDNGLQYGFGGVGYDFGVNAIVVLEQAENDGLAICAVPTLTTHRSGTEAGFTGLNFSAQRRAFKTPLAHAFSDA